MTVHRVVGVFHATGTLRGELRYAFDKLRGAGSCPLCDVTHGMLGEKRALAACRAALPVPLDLLHLDEQPPALAAFTAGRTPCVVAETDAGLVMLLDPGALAALGGDVDAFEEALRSALAG